MHIGDAEECIETQPIVNLTWVFLMVMFDEPYFPHPGSSALIATMLDLLKVNQA